MSRGVFNTADGIRVQPFSEDRDGARVRVASVGICTSDLWVMGMGPSPFVVGHEFAGHLDDGTLVAAYPLTRCGECDQCARGAFNRCRQVFAGSMGLGAHGGMRDEVVMPAADLLPLPPGLAPGNASLVEPFAVGFHAAERAQVQPGQRIAVIGAGALGLTVAAVLRGAGHDVAIAARHPHQQKAAEQLGLRLGLGTEYDLVVDAAGTESGLQQAAELLAPGGTLLLLGLYPPTGVNFPALPLMMKEANVVTATAYCHGGERSDWVAAADYLAANPDTIDALVTHRFALDDAAAAFAMATNRAAGAIKVLVTP